MKKYRKNGFAVGKAGCHIKNITLVRHQVSRKKFGPRPNSVADLCLRAKGECTWTGFASPPDWDWPVCCNSRGTEQKK